MRRESKQPDKLLTPELRKVQARKIRNRWLHKFAQKGNMMFLDAFRDALECSEEAGEIAASFLRFHDQAKWGEETQNQMLQEAVRYLKSC